MNTAEEWLRNMWDGSDSCINGRMQERIVAVNSEDVKAIQLDAFKAGMMEAATIAIAEAERYRSEIPNLATTHIPAEELVYACNKVVLKIDLACQAKKDL